MNGSYQELIILAKDGICVGDIIKEENRLLYEFSSDENRQKIKSEHYQILDDMITALFIPNNIFEEYVKDIQELQDYLQTRM